MEDRIGATTFRIEFRLFWSPFCQGERAVGEDALKTIGDLSMGCFGFCALALPGETCRPTMGIGRIHTDAFAAGGKRGFGRPFLKI